jgi:streptogramin lyase
MISLRLPLILILGLASIDAANALEGTALSAGKPMADANVVLWAAQGKDMAQEVARTTTGDDGSFKFEVASTPESILYITAGSDPVEQMLILGMDRPEKVVLNELTTIASAFTGAQFLSGTNFSGHDLGLKIASGNVKNLVNPETGEWGDVLINGNNSSLSSTLARFNTMGNLLALCGLPEKKEHCDALLKLDATGQGKTLGVAQSIARAPWKDADKLFGLFDSGYVAPKTDNPQERRAGVTYVPYLSWAPTDWALSLKFTGGGVFSLGRILFDADGNMWSGSNWMPGGQNGAIRGIGGGLAAMKPDGTPFSPPITGFTGMGIDGVGWGTGVSDKAVWLTSFNSTIGIFDLNGQPLGPDEGITFDGKLGQGQGVGIAPNGDVWIADSTRDQLAFFPGGDPAKGELMKVDGLKAPFHIAIDADNRVWVTNSRGNNVTVFPGDNPTDVRQIAVGVAVRGLALDSEGNAWVASNLTPGFQPPDFPRGEISIMKEFEVAYNDLALNARHLPTGTIHFIPNDGKFEAQLMQKGSPTVPVNVPWGVVADGKDNIWVGNFLGTGLFHLCGANTANCPEGKKTGDIIHYYVNGNTQKVTSVQVDPAGNIWYANNWNEVTAITDIDPDRSLITQAGGDGVVVFYGLAAPVKTPLIGPVRTP